MARTSDNVKRSRAEYLDHVAAAEPGRAYKPAVVEMLALRPGHSVLDVGCGPGTDLAAMAALVDDGRVMGLDTDTAMVAQARQRLAARSNVQVRVGDAPALPVGDANMDRVRMDRRWCARVGSGDNCPDSRPRRGCAPVRWRRCRCCSPTMPPPMRFCASRP